MVLMMLWTVSISYVGGDGGTNTKRLYKPFSVFVTNVVVEKRPFGRQQAIVNKNKD